jgi:hypothetical protein
MRLRYALCLTGLLCTPAIAAEPANIPQFSKVQSDYLLACGGCHGENGVSNARLVPDLRDQVGYFLNTPQGRRYLVQLPNVATAALDDASLAAVLNFMVWEIGGASVPAGASRYSAPEVSTLRRERLNEVSLKDYRKQLVELLIAKHGAPTAMRYYSTAAEVMR